MNKDNFQKLIDAIELDGQFRFNMGCFVGKLILDGEEEELIKNGDSLASDYEINSIQEIYTTEMFNCDSVGCIAGFATALSNDWKTPDWIKKGNTLEEEPGTFNVRAHDLVRLFELQSNAFLGLTKEQGRRLYYGDSDTIWKYLKYYEGLSYEYSDLKYVGEDDDNADEILNHEVNWDDEDHEIFLGSITYKTAIYVLRKIMNGQIVIDEINGSITVNELQQSNKEG